MAHTPPFHSPPRYGIGGLRKVGSDHFFFSFFLYKEREMGLKGSSRRRISHGEKNGGGLPRGELTKRWGCMVQGKEVDLQDANYQRRQSSFPAGRSRRTCWLTRSCGYLFANWFFFNLGVPDRSITFNPSQRGNDGRNVISSIASATAVSTNTPKEERHRLGGSAYGIDIKDPHCGLIGGHRGTIGWLPS